MQKIFAILFTLSLAIPAQAQDKRAQSTRVITGLDAVALNAGAAALTFAVSDAEGLEAGASAGYEYLILYVQFDYTATAGKISVVCTGGPSSEDNDYRLTVIKSVTDGVGASDLGGSLISDDSMSADTKWIWRIWTMGARDISCVFAHDGAPGATDKLTAKYQLMAKWGRDICVVRPHKANLSRR